YTQTHTHTLTNTHTHTHTHAHKHTHTHTHTRESALSLGAAVEVVAVLCIIRTNQIDMAAGGVPEIQQGTPLGCDVIHSCRSAGTYLTFKGSPMGYQIKRQASELQKSPALTAPRG